MTLKSNTPMNNNSFRSRWDSNDGGKTIIIMHCACSHCGARASESTRVIYFAPTRRGGKAAGIIEQKVKLIPNFKRISIYCFLVSWIFYVLAWVRKFDYVSVPRNFGSEKIVLKYVDPFM